jgi:hypothetical protein
MLCAPHTLSSRPEHSLSLAEGNAKWRDLLLLANYHYCRIVLTLLVLMGPFLVENARGQYVETSRPLNPGLTCSPAPCVLPPTQASEGGSTVTDTPIVTNPMNSEQLLLGSVDYNCSKQSNLGFHLSRNGGPTWERVECMLGIVNTQHDYLPLDEPSVGYDRNGNAYFGGVYFDSEGQGEHGLVAVQRSTDGTHWSKPVVAMHLPGQTFPFESRMTVDISAGSTWVNSLYISGVMWTDQGRKNQVAESHSIDGGSTWTLAEVDSVQEYPASDNLTRTTVGKDGTVYITWVRCSSPCRAANIVFSKSTDGGNTWSSPQRIAKVMMPVDWSLPITYERAYNYPAIASDNSDGPYSGNLYVVMYTWTGAYLRVQMIRSTDGGDTWSQPILLAPKSDTHDQFFSSISVSPTGKVGVSWLDRRNDPANIDYQAFAAISTDGGQSFGANWQLTTAFSDPRTNGTENNWMGDYTGNTWAGDTFIAAWMDSSNGVDMQEVVGGVRLK